MTFASRAGTATAVGPRLLVLALLAVLATLVPAIPAAGAPLRPELAGTTVLTGSQTSVVPVRLSRPATLTAPDFGGGAGVVASGGGRLAGFALVSDEDRPERILVGGRLPWNVSASLPSVTVVIPLAGYPFFGPYEIPAGDYRLYLLTDGEPARVELRFGGLDGETTLQPVQAVPQTFRVLDEPLIATPGQGYVALGSSARLSSNGLIFNSRLARYESYIGERVESCVYERETTDTDFAPNCPPDGAGLALVTADLSAGAAGGATLDWGGVPHLTPGAWGTGFNQQSVGSLVSVQYMALWLDYEPAAASVEPTAAPSPGPAPVPDPQPAGTLADPPAAAVNVAQEQLPATGADSGLALAACAAVVLGGALARRRQWHPAP